MHVIVLLECYLLCVSGSGVTLQRARTLARARYKSCQSQNDQRRIFISYSEKMFDGGS